MALTNKQIGAIIAKRKASQNTPAGTSTAPKRTYTEQQLRIIRGTYARKAAASKAAATQVAA